MKINRIAVACILLLSVSCRSREDRSACFDEGRIENNTYISDSAGWEMTIPHGWELTPKIENEDVNKAQRYFDIQLSRPRALFLISLKKEAANTFRSCIYHPANGNTEELEEIMASNREAVSSVRPPAEIVTLSPVRKEIIDGIEFRTYSYHCFLPYPANKNIYGLLYMGLMGNKYVEVSINYTNTENRNEILNAWLNSVFDKRKWRGE